MTINRRWIVRVVVLAGRICVGLSLANFHHIAGSARVFGIA